MSCTRTQRSDAGVAGTGDPSVSSQTLSQCAPERRGGGGGTQVLKIVICVLGVQKNSLMK